MSKKTLPACHADPALPSVDALNIAVRDRPREILRPLNPNEVAFGIVAVWNPPPQSEAIGLGKTVSSKNTGERK